MIIGNFVLKSNNSFNGEIHTLSLHLPSVRIQFIPLSGKKPDYIVRSFPQTSLLRSLSQSEDFTEIGAAWKRSGPHGDFISVKLDCPTLAQPINGVLRPAKDSDTRWQLVWRRGEASGEPAASTEVAAEA